MFPLQKITIKGVVLKSFEIHSINITHLGICISLPLSLENRPNVSNFGKITKILTCLIENRGIGVTTTLGTSEFIYPNGCFKHTNHHPGREFPCGVGISVSRVFRVILHIDLAILYHSGWGLEWRR